MSAEAAADDDAVDAVYVLRRRRREMARPFRMSGHPVTPAIFMVVTVFMAAFAFEQWRGPSLFSLASILAGIPFYYVWSSLCGLRAA